MASFKAVLPDAVMRDFKFIYDNTEEIFGEMTQAGAGVAMGSIKAGVPLPEMAGFVKLTRTYRTPSDGGINTKVYMSGYLPFKGNRSSFDRRGRSGNGTVYKTNKGIPVDFLGILYEYGRSNRPFPKKPFLRSAFGGGAIEEAMLEAQRRASGGLLE